MIHLRNRTSPCEDSLAFFTIPYQKCLLCEEHQGTAQRNRIQQVYTGSPPIYRLTRANSRNIFGSWQFLSITPKSVGQYPYANRGIDIA
ncbi:MAG: hypothetical protein DWI02_13380 [Planctomycetota bacterium]|nr:MAG: hypothetical protein DWI02_13380 [Planctomycetota bacterium]